MSIDITFAASSPGAVAATLPIEPGTLSGCATSDVDAYAAEQQVAS
jgi:hypothetical protein